MKFGAAHDYQTDPFWGEFGGPILTKKGGGGTLALETGKKLK